MLMACNKHLIKPLEIKRIHDITRDICQETKLPPKVVMLVITKLVEYIVLQMFSGNAVKLLDLCTFHIRLWHLSGVLKGKKNVGCSYIPYARFTNKFSQKIRDMQPVLFEKMGERKYECGPRNKRKVQDDDSLVIENENVSDDEDTDDVYL